MVSGFITDAQIPLVGQYWARIVARERCVRELVYVTSAPNINILPCAASEALGLAFLVRTVSELSPEQKYPKLFSGKPGRIKGFQVKLSVNPDVQPVQEPRRRVPMHLRPQVEHRMNDHEVIERPPPNEPTTWLAPMTLVQKHRQEEVRLCTENRQANRAILRKRHPMPTLKDIRYALNGARFLSKLGMSKARMKRLISPYRTVTVPYPTVPYPTVPYPTVPYPTVLYRS